MELVWVLMLLPVIIAYSSSVESRVKQVERAVQRVEWKIDLLLEQTGVELPEPEGMAEVDALLRKGKTIEAVRRYRKITGAGLKEAKEAVERRQV